jgi:hypothetical protein
METEMKEISCLFFFLYLKYSGIYEVVLARLEAEPPPPSSPDEVCSLASETGGP